MIMHEDVSRFLPPDWPHDVPLARVRTCGCSPILIEVLCGFENPAFFHGPLYVPAEENSGQASNTTLALLAFLASQPRGYASQDALAQALRPGRRVDSFQEEDAWEDRALKRPENV